VCKLSLFSLRFKARPVITEAAFPQNVILAVLHSVFVKGDQANFEIKPSFGVEASELYPDVKYTTVDQYMDQFI